MKRLLFFVLCCLGALQSQAQCTASFTASPAPTGPQPLRIQVVNTSTIGPVSGTLGPHVTVDYGDATSPSQYYYLGTYNHNYASPGTYMIKLIVRKIDTFNNTIYCIDSISQSITIAYPPPNCNNLHALFTPSTYYNQAFFYNSSYSTVWVPNGRVSYAWNFGDGNTSTAYSPSHLYAATGTYNVKLVATLKDTLTNTIVCQDSVTTAVVISNMATPVPCSTLNASFSASVSGMTATFINSSSNPPGSYIQRWSNWAFGDNTYSSSNAGTVNHTYSAAGTYTVTLYMNWYDSINNIYCIDSEKHTVTIIPGPTNISGYIIGDSLNYADTNIYKVWLIVHDSLTNVLSAVDSVNVTGTLITPYTFSNVPSGIYTVKAAKTNAVVGTTGLVPTYHFSSLYWGTANFIYLGSVSATGKNILMRIGTVTAGPGFIAGNVSLGANKGTSGGVAGMTIFLRNTGNNLVAAATTDANGDYTFNNIPAGNYNIYPEQMNYATTPSGTVSITGAQSSVTGVNFNQDNAKQSIKPRSTTGVGQVPGNTPSISIYPNPARQLATIRWSNFSDKTADVLVADLAGHVVIRETVQISAGNAAVNVGKLQSGVYFVKMKANGAEAIDKLIIAH